VKCLVGTWVGSTCKDLFFFKLLSCIMVYDGAVVEIRTWPARFPFFSC